MMIELMADPGNPWFDDVNTPEVETRDDILRRGLSDALDWLSEQYGEDPQGWEWGRLHTLTFVHNPIGQSGIAPLERIFNAKTIGARGDPFSVNEAAFRWDRPFSVIHSVAQRMIVDLGDLDNSLAIHTTGQSGQTFHPHREDFVSMWQNVEYHPMPFTRQAVEANAKTVLTLIPQEQE
jgi:penicillin amidase